MSLGDLISAALDGRKDSRVAEWSLKLPERLLNFRKSLSEVPSNYNIEENPERGYYFDDVSGFVGCHENTFEREEAHSRALFNLKHVFIDSKTVRLVDYEPRVAEGCKLDILGRSEDGTSYFAIEYKYKPGTKTDLEYALFESLAYGYFVKKVSKKSCKYLVAGPLSYFKEYLNRDSGQTPDWQERKGRILALENLLLNELNSDFLGYFVVGDLEKTLFKRISGEHYTPHFYLHVRTSKELIDSIV